ncbi:putative transferase CAF17, mitochondrial [Gracilariopsis chorda]|uniref:Putative transferase CAF17, mitochondrial n=1 Tax=Gracilariopsis chorda TaxID=448386 RepID=A0A2V3J0Z9_9FLOR|nr:putative transferase CAF17, mitochondrial [Gracilariopsis chorda]|eukprot:PXF47617.1 putative transferase CAF17, mitochondrial [Gracilariopsis chorda]
MTAPAVRAFATKLRSRGIVRVQGADSLKFLQGLITNDMHHICNNHTKALSAPFLNGRGRVLFGTIIQRQHENDYLIDVSRAQVPNLISHLTKFRLRAKVHVSDQSDSHAVWAVVNSTSGSTDRDSRLFEDPRLEALGLRAIVDEGFTPPPDVTTADEDEYERVRILNGVPDGSDFDETPLPLDLGLHLLNGVSFSKGCYLGQELTARSHFTGVLRKRITPVIITEQAPLGARGADRGMVSDDAELRLPSGAELFLEGKNKPAGRVTSSVDNIGMAVLRLSDIFSTQGTNELRLQDGRLVTAWKPPWWRERTNEAAAQ